jgi:glycosyltransferase involved in cell wall biosynthesis
MKTPIKILYVIDSYQNPNAGTEGQLFQLIKHLDRELFEPRLLVLQGTEWLKNNTFPCEVDSLGYSSIKSPKTWLFLLKSALKYKREGYKLVHVFFNDASVICPPVFKCIGIKTFISRRDMGYWYNNLYRKILPVTGKCTEGVIVNSKAVGDITSKVEKFTPDKIHVIYNGFVDKKSISGVVNEIVEFKQASILFAIVANIRSIKRINDAIEALALLNKYDVKLVIIGGGDPSDLQALAVNKGIAERVLFLGSRGDVRSCLQHADVGLLCSESEGFSNSIVEYQLSKLPVICSKVGGNPEAVTHSENGYLYDFGDINELTKLMRLLLDNHGRIKEMGLAGYNNAKNNYSISSMVLSHHNLYNVTIKN